MISAWDSQEQPAEQVQCGNKWRKKHFEVKKLTVSPPWNPSDRDLQGPRLLSALSYETCMVHLMGLACQTRALDILQSSQLCQHPGFFFYFKFSFSLFSLISGKIAGTNPGTWALILHLYIHSSRPGKACVSVMQRHVPDSLASPLLWCPLRSGRAQRLRCPVPRTKWQTVHE